MFSEDGGMIVLGKEDSIGDGVLEKFSHFHQTYAISFVIELFF
jgi:hypothetical protein